jgi:Galactose oxidase, central domain/Kelch motif
VIGGRKGGLILTDPSAPVSYADVDRYDPRHHRWRRMRAMPQPRSGFAAVALADGRIVVFGGEPWPNNVPGAKVIGTVCVRPQRQGGRSRRALQLSRADISFARPVRCAR